MDCYFCNFYVRLPSKWTRSGEFCIVLYREILTRWKLNRCLELAQYYPSLVSIICWELDWWRNLNRASLCILKPNKNSICWLIKNESCKGKEPPDGGSFLVYLVLKTGDSHLIFALRILAKRFFSHPDFRTVFCFCFRSLIGCLGILGLLRRRMVVVSHLFRHRRC